MPTRKKNGSAIIAHGERWLAALKAQGRSAKTIAAYASALKNLRRFLETKRVRTIAAVDSAALEAWQRQLTDSGCALGTLDSFTRAVQQWFSWLTTKGILFADPAASLQKPRFERPLGRCPSESEVARLLDSVDGNDPVSLRDRAILEIAYGSGPRREEFTRLNVSSIDPVNRIIRILGKGDRERAVPMTTAAQKAVQKFLRHGRPQLCREHSGDALFLSFPDGHRLGHAAIAGIIKRRAAHLGLELTPHDLRRAFGTHLLRAGAHPALVKDLLGHASYRHLRPYIKLSATEIVAALRASRINR